MRVVLARIDDRFIHGQVTVGWSRVLNPNRIILCNDGISTDPWQSRVYASSVPPHMEVLVLSRKETCRRLCSGESEGRPLRTILLVDRPSDMLDLKRGGLALGTVNIGGMHYQSGKHELQDQIYVDRPDVTAMRQLLQEGVHLQVQSVPGAPSWLVTDDMLSSCQENF